MNRQELIKEIAGVIKENKLLFYPNGHEMLTNKFLELFERERD